MLRDTPASGGVFFQQICGESISFSAAPRTWYAKQNGKEAAAWYKKQGVPEDLDEFAAIAIPIPGFASVAGFAVGGLQFAPGDTSGIVQPARFLLRELFVETSDTTVAIMDAYLEANGYENDFSDTRLHHEIYLSDARKVAPEKWKTVIRHSIKKR